MGKRALTLMALVIALFSVQVSYAETWTVPRGGVQLKDRPQINGKVIARVPAKTRLKSLNKRGYWIQVAYQGTIGWVPMNAVRLAVGEEKSEIDIIHTHTRNLGGLYKHIFKIRNIGMVPFSGTVTLRGYVSGEIAFNEIVSFQEQPIAVRAEREAVVEIKSDFTRFEYTIEK
jgi:hypothetical protein